MRSALFLDIALCIVVIPYRSVGTDILSGNVGKELPLHGAKYPRGAQISSALRQKREISQIYRICPKAATLHLLCKPTCFDLCQVTLRFTFGL
jgi:hypothetical protein